LRGDIRARIDMVKRVQAQMALQEQAINALVELVEDEAPEPLVAQEAEQRLHNLSHRLTEQGADLGQYLQVTGSSPEDLLEQLKGEATAAVKADLALRALADAEALAATDDDVDEQIVRLAERFDRKPAELRRDLEKQDSLPTVRSDVRKAKALEWLLEHVEVVDEEGQPIDRALLTAPAAEGSDDTEGSETEA
ncbi:MAG: trigger factor, partial [Actinomycetota bacterium]|nr:trigger factor [Actinomycetota bacterium]